MPRNIVRTGTSGATPFTTKMFSPTGGEGDGLFGGVALALRKRNGYVTRIHDDELDMGNDNGQAARGAIVWRPSATFEVFATADYSRRRENGAPTVNGGVNDKQAFGTFGNAALPGCTAITVNPDFPGNGPPTFPPPGEGAGGAEGCYGPDGFAGEYISEGTFPAFDSLDSWGTGAKVSLSLGGGVTLRSLTGYRGLDLRSSRDADNTPANILQIQIAVESEQLSQELQLSGFGLDDRLHWQTGLYLVREVGVLSGRRDAPDRGVRQQPGPGQLVDGRVRPGHGRPVGGGVADGRRALHEGLEGRDAGCLRGG